MPITCTFGELEAALAAKHEIASDKRTQFQARLRKLQRLGIPSGVGSGRGVVGRYGAGQIVETALALEFTELGLTPERLIRVIKENGYVIGVAVALAGASLREKPDVVPWEDRTEELLHMFLYFDPNALRALTDQENENWDWAATTLFRNCAANVREYIVQWTLELGHLSLINVTVLLGQLASCFEGDDRDSFLAEALDWADEIQNKDLARGDEPAPPTQDQEEAAIALRQVVSSDWRDALLRLLATPRASIDDEPKSLAALLSEFGLTSDFVHWVEDAKRGDGLGSVDLAFIALPSSHTLIAEVASLKEWRSAEGARRQIKRYFCEDRKSLEDLSVDYNVMYVPQDAVLKDALDRDPDLYSDAFKHRVLLTSPTSMSAVARAVSDAWNARVGLQGWTEERVETLRELWAEGRTASQIACALGGVSRHAVVAKAFLLKLPPGRSVMTEGEDASSARAVEQS